MEKRCTLVPGRNSNLPKYFSLRTRLRRSKSKNREASRPSSSIMRVLVVQVATMEVRYRTSVPRPKPIQLATVNLEEQATEAYLHSSLEIWQASLTISSSSWRITPSTAVSPICKAALAPNWILILSSASTTRIVSNEPMPIRWPTKVSNKTTISTDTKSTKSFDPRSKFQCCYPTVAPSYRPRQADRKRRRKGVNWVIRTLNERLSSKGEASNSKLPLQEVPVYRMKFVNIWTSVSMRNLLSLRERILCTTRNLHWRCPDKSLKTCKTPLSTLVGQASVPLRPSPSISAKVRVTAPQATALAIQVQAFPVETSITDSHLPRLRRASSHCRSRPIRICQRRIQRSKGPKWIRSRSWDPGCHLQGCKLLIRYSSSNKLLIRNKEGQ